MIFLKWRQKWRTKSIGPFSQKCSPSKFKKCFGFCHFLQLVFVLFLLLFFIHFFFPALLLLIIQYSFFFFLAFIIFFLHIFFGSHLLILVGWFFFLFFFYVHPFLLLICFGFFCNFSFNKNIICNFLLSNRSMWVNLYKLCFLSSHFSPYTNKWVFHPSNQTHMTHMREN